MAQKLTPTQRAILASADPHTGEIVIRDGRHVRGLRTLIELGLVEKRGTGEMHTYPTGVTAEITAYYKI